VTGPHNLRVPGQSPEHEAGFFLGFLVSEKELSSLLRCWHQSTWNQLLTTLLGLQSKTIFNYVHSSAHKAKLK